MSRSPWVARGGGPQGARSCDGTTLAAAAVEVPVPHLSVRALIPLLATACSSAAECWKSDPPPVDADVEVTAEELAQVLDKYGSFDERACTELCELHVPAEE